MAVDNVTTTSSVGVDGNSFTTSVSNDTLTSEDFLTLMLAELQQQDPTEPQDTAAILDSQMQLSTIQSNLEMTEAMASLQASYSNSALSTASNMIGHIIEDGSTDSAGTLRSYSVSTIENLDGELYVNAYELVGFTDGLMNTETDELTLYDANGNIYENDTVTDYHLSLDADGRFVYNDDGSLKILDTNNDVVTDTTITDKYAYAGSSIRYSDEISVIPLANIQQVR